MWSIPMTSTTFWVHVYANCTEHPQILLLVCLSAAVSITLAQLPRLDKSNQLLLQVSLPTCFLQVIQAAKIKYNVSCLSKVDLEA